MSLVLDSSVALAWVYQDENSQLANDVQQRVVVDGASVPAIWRLEVANGLRTGIRRGRITQNERDHALSEFGRLNILVDDETDRHAWGATLRLSDQLGVTPYDASYLELAQRLGLPVASLDIRLRAAARAADIQAIGD
jgi:predicted nucleic acid-binding protein